MVLSMGSFNIDFSLELNYTPALPGEEKANIS